MEGAHFRKKKDDATRSKSESYRVFFMQTRTMKLIDGIGWTVEFPNPATIQIPSELIRYGHKELK